jgi:6-phospho-beta-glucosidase
MPARILDEKIPLKYDLLGQETTGVGGFFKGLRTLPIVENIVHIMEKVARNAWLINFSNPSGMVAQMLSQISDIRYAGLCNGPVKTDMYLRNKAPLAAWFDYDFVGLNHLNWVTGVWVDGRDFMPNLLDSKDREEAPDMLRAIGGIPCEYLHYYYHQEKAVSNCKSQSKSRGEECIEIEEGLLKIYQNPELKTKPNLLNERGGAMYSEAAVSLIEAIENDRRTVHVINVNHGGTVPFLDSGDVAEVKCVVGKDGPRPLPLMNQDINEHIIGLTRAVKAFEKLTIKAALTGDYEAGLAALMTHPLVGDFDKAKAVYDEMLEAHRPYLPRFFK